MNSSSDDDKQMRIMVHYKSIIDDDDSDDEAIVYMEIQQWLALTKIMHDTGELKTRRMVNRRREEGHQRLWHNYFAEDPVFNEYFFRRRFRIRYGVFNRILEGVTAYDNYFVQKPDAYGRLGLTTHQKVVATLRVLAYGASHDIWDEYLCIGETTVLKTVVKFFHAIVAVFGQEFSRAPTVADVHRINEQNTLRGFPGMLGSIDCMHWKWKNCPIAWHGQYRRHKEAPTLILEAVASYDLWIWQSFFGMPGSCNDLNVLHRSTVFEDLLCGRTPPMNYTINGNDYDMGYYLADGIYPPYTTIVQTYKDKTHLSQKQKLFAQYQEGCRKDVERAFGVLQARFAFIREPTKLWNRDSLSMIMKACIIMHNMIVDDERRDCTWHVEYDESEPPPEILRHPTASFYNDLQRDARMRDKEKNKQLRTYLTQHIWDFDGNQQG